MNADKRRYRLTALLGALVLGISVVYVIFQGNWKGGLVLSAFLALSVFVVVRRSRLPAFFEVIFVAALIVNAAGYTWNLWDSVSWYDEVVHLYTGFAVTLALGFMFYEELMQAYSSHRPTFVLTITSFGLALGAAWEIAEWGIELLFNHDMIGDVRDTMIDLLLDTAGALAAALTNLSGLNED